MILPYTPATTVGPFPAAPLDLAISCHPPSPATESAGGARPACSEAEAQKVIPTRGPSPAKEQGPQSSGGPSAAVPTQPQPASGKAPHAQEQEGSSALEAPAKGRQSGTRTVQGRARSPASRERLSLTGEPCRSGCKASGKQRRRRKGGSRTGRGTSPSHALRLRAPVSRAARRRQKPDRQRGLDGCEADRGERRAGRAAGREAAPAGDSAERQPAARRGGTRPGLIHFLPKGRPRGPRPSPGGNPPLPGRGSPDEVVEGCAHLEVTCKQPGPARAGGSRDPPGGGLRPPRPARSLAPRPRAAPSSPPARAPRGRDPSSPPESSSRGRRSPPGPGPEATGKPSGRKPGGRDLPCPSRAAPRGGRDAPGTRAGGGRGGGTGAPAGRGRSRAEREGTRRRSQTRRSPDAAPSPPPLDFFFLPPRPPRSRRHPRGGSAPPRPPNSSPDEGKESRLPPPGMRRGAPSYLGGRGGGGGGGSCGARLASGGGAPRGGSATSPPPPPPPGPPDPPPGRGKSAARPVCPRRRRRAERKPPRPCWVRAPGGGALGQSAGATKPQCAEQRRSRLSPGRSLPRHVSGCVLGSPEQRVGRLGSGRDGKASATEAGEKPLSAEDRAKFSKQRPSHVLLDRGAYKPNTSVLEEARSTGVEAIVLPHQLRGTGHARPAEGGFPAASDTRLGQCGPGLSAASPISARGGRAPASSCTRVTSLLLRWKESGGDGAEAPRAAQVGGVPSGSRGFPSPRPQQSCPRDPSRPVLSLQGTQESGAAPPSLGPRRRAPASAATGRRLPPPPPGSGRGAAGRPHGGSCSRGGGQPRLETPRPGGSQARKGDLPEPVGQPAGPGKGASARLAPSAFAES
uniref:collagen alpha-1(I) chain-like n=1 Tax=Podarcis muralis TaxID=64176 RepID=UPI00109FA6D3|nr:collagen alpha-1(I) chain-like [Podarcis muralis]